MKYLFCCLILLLLLGSAISTVTADNPQAPTAAEIINKHLAAAGGKEALAKLKSRIAIGTVKKENDPGIKMAIMSEAPNRVSAVYVLERYDWQLTYDGRKALVRTLVRRALPSLQDKQEDMLSSGPRRNCPPL